jgi:tetratricopeptide (TPR) repeat protein
MTRVPTIDRITAVFAQLESYLKLKGRQNLNDAAVLAEDFCKHLLNRLYGHSLINLNTLDPNAAATDLIDTGKRIGFQITANATTEKIRDVHRKATDHKLAARLDHLTILFLVAKASTEPEPSGKFTPCARPVIISRDLSSLISDIREMDVPQQQEIADFLEQEWGRPEWHHATRISNLPFASLGDHFIGRTKFMGDLEQSLGGAGPTVIKGVQAIHGMGGVGKTRAAIEYAWRHAADSGALLFVTVDSPDSLRRNLAALCAPAILNLPEHAATDTETQVAAVLAWLKKTPDWLLILDNVDSPAAQAEVQKIATPLLHGRLLITSRLAAWPTGFAALDLDVLSPTDSVKLLTDHTAGFRIPEPDEATAAAEIGRLVDGLALALEQAAAHIRKIRCSFATYLKKWRDAETRLLADYHLRGIGDYHAPVADQQPQDDLPRSLCVTFDASFRQLAPPARRLLQLLAWLAPDPMPVAHLETLDALPAATETLADLAELHLVRYSADNRAFAVHRLIQEIVRREQTEPQPQPLLEALVWVNGLFPYDLEDVCTWNIAAPLTPHAVAVATFAADRDILRSTDRLLNQAAALLHIRADHRAAEPLMRRALAIGEASFGKDHPKIAASLNNLALLLKATSRLAEAEPLMRRALAIDEASFGPDHPLVASRFNNLAALLQATNRLAEAEPLIRRALAIAEASSDTDHSEVARYLNNLAQLLQATNRLAEAEPLMRRALAIGEASSGPDHPEVATFLDNLAGLLQATNRLAEAEPLMRRALAIDEASFGTDHPDVAIRLSNLASLLLVTNRLAEAEPLMRRMVEIFLNFTRATGHPHPHLQTAMDNYLWLLRALGWSGEEIGSELSALAGRYGVDLSGMDGLRGNTPSAKLRPVLVEIMRDQSKASEIAARLQAEDPELAMELLAFLKSLK